MKLETEKLIPYLIVVVPLILVLSVSFFMTNFYLHKVTAYLSQEKENAIKEYVGTQKEKSQYRAEQLIALFESTNKSIQPAIRTELKKRVELAYTLAHKIQQKYKYKSKKWIKQEIKNALSNMMYEELSENIFITDFNANPILNASHLKERGLSLYRDADNRAIVLEEIQKVRRHTEGFIESKRFSDNEDEIIFVKNLELYNWYIGSSIRIKTKREQLQKDLLKMIQSMPVDKSDFIALYSHGKKLYMSNECNLTEDTHKYTSYYKAFDWRLEYGFNTTTMSAITTLKQEKLEALLSDELAFIMKVSLLISMFVLLLSLLLSFKINNTSKSKKENLPLSC